MATQGGRSQQQGLAAGPRPLAWGVYFPEDDYAPEDRRVLLIRELADLFGGPAGWAMLAAGAAPYYGRVTLDLDWQALAAGAGSADLREAMEHAPAEAAACVAAAAHEALFSTHAARTKAALPALPEGGRVLVRLRNHPDAFRPISAIKADAIGRLVAVRGTVTRATPTRPLVTELQFVCGKCGSPHLVPFPDGRFAPPVSCGADGCRSRTFAPNRGVATCIDWRRIQLQALPRDERGREGRVPPPLDVELCEDLAESCGPGDVVTITGLIKVVSGDPGPGSKFGDPKKQCLFLPYMEALSVVPIGKEGGPPPHHHRQAPGGGAAGEELLTCTHAVDGGAALDYLPPDMPGFSQLDLRFIVTFTETCEGDQFRVLTQSLCPSIFGQELVKAGLLLALFGGVSRTPGGPGAVPTRGDLHVLLVGDPGLGKSQLLQATAAAAPRGVYVCGSGTSAAGLTAAVVRGEGGEASFDAGALVLADRGVCCVDEFDKMAGEHAAMLGAMEQQEVAVAKAGLVAALPARTAVVAAANPVEGHYNRGRSITENLKMSPAMLSRFDLVFLLIDRPDPERDQRLTAHLMAIHSGIAPRAAAAARGRLALEAAPAPLLLTDGAGGSGGAGRRVPLLERLRAQRPDDEPLPVALLRKYIAYARQYVHPRLSDEAKLVLKESYLQLRQRSTADTAGLPITHRTLEGLARLAEARARAELREVVTAEDARDAVEVAEEALAGHLPQGPGLLDFGRGGGFGGGARGRGGAAAERRRFMDALCALCSGKGSREVEVHELYDVADRIDLAVPDTAAFIESLNEAGDLLKKGGGRYQVSGALRPIQPSQSAGPGGGGGYSSQRSGASSQQLPTGSKRGFGQG